MSERQVHYLDHAATAPLLRESEEAWLSAQHALRTEPGNPAALHEGGRHAQRLLEDARSQVAQCVGADRHQVIFTSGATESDALAVHGGARWVRNSHPECTRVWLSQADHDAVVQQAPVLENDGFSVSRFPLGADGVSVVEQWDDDTALVSMALVCSELGTIQPVADLAAMRGQDRTPLIHTDAAQALTCEDVNFSQLGVDLMTIGGHKLGAPVGTGVLVTRHGLSPVGDRPGGGQERGVRSGTVDVAGACALAAALQVTVARRHLVREHLRALGQRLLGNLPEGVRRTIPAQAPTTPSIVHLSMDTHHPEAVLMALDMAGVWASAGSACHAGVTRPSSIVLAMGKTENEALGVLRVSMGADTTTDDIDALLAALPQAVRAGQALDGRK